MKLLINARQYELLVEEYISIESNLPIEEVKRIIDLTFEQYQEYVEPPKEPVIYQINRADRRKRKWQ